MDKEKEFEKMEKKIAEICPALFEDGCEEIVCARCLANKLQKAGYGNVEQYKKELEENEKLLAQQWRVVCEQKKQAVREFAEKLKTYCQEQFEILDKLYDAIDDAELALQFIERRNEYHNMKLKIDELIEEL